LYKHRRLTNAPGQQKSRRGLAIPRLRGFFAAYCAHFAGNSLRDHRENIPMGSLFGAKGTLWEKLPGTCDEFDAHLSEAT
jgi:hypothetical protein